MAEHLVSEQDQADRNAGSGETGSEEMQRTPVSGLSPAARLIPRQMALLAALVCNPDIHFASRTAGVSRTTAYRWLKEPAFLEELNRQRDAALSEALATVKTHATRAVAELAGLLSAKDERLRRQVCNDLLAHAMKVRELEDIERRLEVLEKAMAEKQTRRHA